MAKRGRRPKPTQLKLLEGNPGRREVNLDEPVSDMPAIKPSVVAMDEIASLEWDRVTAAMPPGIYTANDAPTLTTYALAWSMLVKSQKDIDENGVTFTCYLTNKKTGEIYLSEIKTNPALRAWKAATETILKCGEKLGLNPAARQSLPKPLDPTKTARSKFAGLLEGVAIG
jgi:P27 family predicted phage terminase small subunit